MVAVRLHNCRIHSEYPECIAAREQRSFANQPLCGCNIGAKLQMKADGRGVRCIQKTVHDALEFHFPLLCNAKGNKHRLGLHGHHHG